MKLTVAIVAMAASCGKSGSISHDAKSILCVAVMGQSNAVGMGDGADLSSDLQSIPILYQAEVGKLTVPPTWTDYGPGPAVPFPYSSGSPSHFGVEMTIAKTLGLSIQKVAVTGASLSVNWNPDGNYPASGLGNLANQAFQTLSNSVKGWSCDGIDLVWIQGETDAENATDASAYAQNLTNLAALERSYVPATTWIVTRLDIQQEQSTLIKAGEILRTQQELFVSQDSNSVLVDTDSIEVGSDYLHWTSQGNLDAGDLIANAITNH